MCRRFIILLIFLVVTGSAYAEEAEKISMAIMDFRANNTKEAFARAGVDILSEKLFATDLFILMEKNQMDRIARNHGFTEFNNNDPEQIARLGKVLKVDKIAVGSITYIDSYIIDIKVLNAATGEIEFNIKRRIRKIEKLEESLEYIAVAIERHYLGYYNLSGKYDLVLEAHFLYPLGIFSKTVNQGSGIQAVLQFNAPFDLPCNVQAVTGFYSFAPARDSLDYFYMFPVYCAVSYGLRPARNIIFSPAAGAGYLFSKISSRYGAAPGDLYWEGKELYSNPSIMLRTGLDIFLYDRWYLVITPQYNIFFEKERIGQFASVSAGIKMLF